MKIRSLHVGPFNKLTVAETIFNLMKIFWFLINEVKKINSQGLIVDTIRGL